MASLLKKGSSGSEVKRLQELLNQSGYGLNVDGIYGDKTYNAVRQYQKANGLGVDGIVGDQTWGSLTKGSGTSTNPGSTNTDTAVTPSAPPSATTPLGTTYNPNETTGSEADLGALEGSGPTFQESQAYKDAMNALQQHQSAKPGAYQSSFSDRLNGLYEQIVGRPEYTSPYGDKIEEIYNQVMSRPAFEYDFNADPLYQQYKDQYIAQGNRAMQNAMANAAALTGGYGNSYAAMAGQQANQQYLSGLNNMIPELMDAAYQRYRDEGQDLYDQMNLANTLDQLAYGRYQDKGQALLNQFEMLYGMDQDAYNRYRDTVGDYYTDLEYLAGMAGDQWNRDNAIYQAALDKYLADRDYYYGKTQDELAQENYLKELELAQSGGSGGGSSGGSSSKGGSSGGKSADYKTVLANAKNMSSSKAYEYVGRMVDAGVITAAEGDRILSIEIGMDVGEYAQDDEDMAFNLIKNFGNIGKVPSTVGGALASGAGVMTDALKNLLDRVKKS